MPHMATHHHHRERLSRVRHLITAGDLLLFRRRGLSRLIHIAGRGEHSHAAVAAWWGPDLMVLEFTAPAGRAVSLDTLVAQLPGLVDWYQADPQARFPDWNREATVGALRRATGRPYNFAGLALAALAHLPVFRLFYPVPIADGGRRLPAAMFCSESVSWAMRAGGFDPVPHLADRATEPADLARSPVFCYAATLYP